MKPRGQVAPCGPKAVSARWRQHRGCCPSSGLPKIPWAGEAQSLVPQPKDTGQERAAISGAGAISDCIIKDCDQPSRGTSSSGHGCPAPPWHTGNGAGSQPRSRVHGASPRPLSRGAAPRARRLGRGPGGGCRRAPGQRGAGSPLPRPEAEQRRLQPCPRPPAAPGRRRRPGLSESGGGAGRARPHRGAAGGAPGKGGGHEPRAGGARSGAGRWAEPSRG